MPHSLIPEYTKMCTKLWRLHTLCLWTENCNVAFHFLPCPSPVHTARGVSPGVSVGELWILNALCFFWWPLNPGISVLSELSNFTPKIIAPVIKNKSQILGFQMLFLLKYSVRKDQKHPLGTLIKKNKMQSLIFFFVLFCFS